MTAVTAVDESAVSGDPWHAPRCTRPALRLGRLIVSTAMQAGGHPWNDQAVTYDADGHEYRSRAICPSWRRTRNRPGGRALVIGWRR